MSYRETLVRLDAEPLLRELMPALGLRNFMVKARERSCDDCSACCTIEAVEGLAEYKPAFKPCPHLSGNACGIYANRPEPCKFYFCGWRMGIGGDEIDPRTSGVLLSLTPIASERDSAEMQAVLNSQIERIKRGELAPLALLCAQVSATGPYDVVPIFMALGQLFEDGLQTVAFTDANKNHKKIARTPNRHIALAWLLQHSETGTSPWNDNPELWMKVNGYGTAKGIVR